LSWYFILFLDVHGAHLTKQWGTINTLPLGQSKQRKAWEVILECSRE